MRKAMNPKEIQEFFNQQEVSPQQNFTQNYSPDNTPHLHNSFSFPNSSYDTNNYSQQQKQSRQSQQSGNILSHIKEEEESLPFFSPSSPLFSGYNSNDSWQWWSNCKPQSNDAQDSSTKKQIIRSYFMKINQRQLAIFMGENQFMVLYQFLHYGKFTWTDFSNSIMQRKGLKKPPFSKQTYYQHLNKLHSDASRGLEQERVKKYQKMYYGIS